MQASVWGYIESFGVSEPVLFVGGCAILHLVVFWSQCLIFHYFDTHTPNVLTRYKIQPGKNEPMEPGKFKHACWIALKNQFLVGLAY